MAKGKTWLQRLADEADLMEENVTADPILELCGNSRVLIEHHAGVVEYGNQQIRVKIRNGEFTVRGKHLTLCRMCGQQLLIRGIIDSIEVRKGRG